jgi:hypothetical protein
MSYAGISVREAMEKLNNLNGGWYLPYIQRQYVWGARYGSEEYVCLLLDSLMRRYPIGGLVLWETTKPVPYRAFLDDYEPGRFPKLVEEGRFGAYKFLVYDGQQRLQTLRSVLYHTFSGRVLHFDLLFDATKANPDETGFLFRDKAAPADPRYLKLTELVSTRCDPACKVELEHRLLEAFGQTERIDRRTEVLIKTNLSALWDIFVDTNVKSLAYFSVRAEDEAPVNEVFRRLNIGGIALTQVELVLGEIKKRVPIYEEKLWELSEEIFKRSNIEFTSDLPPDFRTIDKLRDWLPIRREQCEKDVFRKSRWWRSSGRGIAILWQRWPSGTASASRRSILGASVSVLCRRATSSACGSSRRRMRG